MAMVCPQCSTPYEQRLQCPLCGVRLHYHDHRRVRGHSAGAPLRWQQTPWGRIFIALLLSQGLFYGLRHLVTAILMATQGEEEMRQMWATPTGFFLIQGVRLFSLLGGAVLAGGGHRNGSVLGAVVGAWNGVLSVLFLPGPAQALTTVAVLGQPLLQMAVGAVGGWLGCAFWKPLPEEPAGAVPARKRSALRRQMDLFAGPVAWFRVAAGAILAVIGTLTATIFFEKVLEVSHGALATSDDMQDHFITLEIKALALLLGGALAGSTTRNGFKQGLFVGLATTVILIGIEMNYVERWLQVAALTAASAFCLSVVGGWFGSQLFPPIVKSRRDRGLGRASL
jgi:hypothetical protein